MTLTVEQAALLIEQRDTAWAALRETGDNVRLAYASALARIAALEAEVNSTKAQLIAVTAALADCSVHEG